MVAKLKIIDASRDGLNGHLIVHARIIEDGEVEGALETFGIDPLALDRRFAGDLTKWLQWVGGQMAYSHRCRTTVHRDIHKLKGTSIELK